MKKKKIFIPLVLIPLAVAIIILSYAFVIGPVTTSISYGEFSSTPGIIPRGFNSVLVKVSLKNETGVDFGLAGIKSIKTEIETSSFKSVTLREIKLYDTEGRPLEQRITKKTFRKKYGYLFLIRRKVYAINNPDVYTSTTNTNAPWSEYLATDLYNGRTLHAYLLADVFNRGSHRIEVKASTINSSGRPTDAVIARWLFNYNLET